MANLRQARAQLLGLQSTHASTSPMVGGLVMADNPFATSQSAANPMSLHLYMYDYALAGGAQTSANGRILIQRADLPQPTEEQQTLADVNRLMMQISDRTSSWVQGGIEIRGRDGKTV